jgi:hypothetical protein
MNEDENTEILNIAEEVTTSKLKRWIKEMKDSLINGYHKLKFLTLVTLLIGIILGGVISYKVVIYKVNEAIILGSYLNYQDGKVYNVQLDPSRSGKR